MTHLVNFGTLNLGPLVFEQPITYGNGLTSTQYIIIQQKNTLFSLIYHEYLEKKKKWRCMRVAIV